MSKRRKLAIAFCYWLSVAFALFIGVMNSSAIRHQFVEMDIHILYYFIVDTLQLAALVVIVTLFIFYTSDKTMLLRSLVFQSYGRLQKAGALPHYMTKEWQMRDFISNMIYKADLDVELNEKDGSTVITIRLPGVD